MVVWSWEMARGLLQPFCTSPLQGRASPDMWCGSAIARDALRAALALQDGVWDVLREGSPLLGGILSTEIELHSGWRAPLLPPLLKTHLQCPQSHTLCLGKRCLVWRKFCIVANGPWYWQVARDVAFHFSLRKESFPDGSPLYPL